MRVLLATDGNLEFQGIVIFMLEWLRALRSIPECSCEVTVYFRKANKDQTLSDAFHALDADVICGNIPEGATSTNPAFRRKVQNDLRTILTEKKYDIIHINTSIKGFTILALQEALRAGVPVRISHSHRRNLDSIIKQLYHPFLQMYIRHTATAYAGCSEDAGEYMFGKAGIRSNKWHFVPNTIDTAKYVFNESARMRCREELNLTPDVMLIGAVGVLYEAKNHAFLLDVLEKLQKTGKKATLILFGGGGLLPMLKEKAAALGLSDQVIFYGVTNDIPSWLSALDCYVMPSLIEGLGIAAVEAQANGLPCLLSDRVPPEVDLCSDVYHLPIDKGPEPWVQKILSLPVKAAEERKRGAEAVRKAGFGKENMPGHVQLLYNF